VSLNRHEMRFEQKAFEVVITISVNARALSRRFPLFLTSLQRSDFCDAGHIRKLVSQIFFKIRVTWEGDFRMSSLSQLRAEKATHRSWLVAAIEDPDLAIVALFCAIGLVATIVVLHHFPNLGAILAQFN
jgi:hypothetical protein